MDIEKTLKQQAADRAVGFVESGMIVGLGTGSTAIFALRRVAESLKSGSLKGITGVATSVPIEEEAIRLGIPMMNDSLPENIDLTIDGADEVDPDLQIIKGAGGALLREKIVAQASRRVIIIVDESKPSTQLGTKCALPVEVLVFGWMSQQRFLKSLGCTPTLREKSPGLAFLTDSGNFILDCKFDGIRNPNALSQLLKARAGIIEHGLFLDIATDVIVARSSGIEHLQKAKAA